MNKKIVVFSFGIIALSMALTAFFYPSLPLTVASHFNMNGEADGFSPRWIVFIIGGLIPAALVALFTIVPKIDPRGESYKKHRKAYEILAVFMVLFLTGVHWLLMLKALGYNVPIVMLIMCGIGVLFLVIGNYMPQIRPNYSFGIRLPWTLDSEDNWRATHRVGGWAFSAAGLICIGAAFLPRFAGTVLFFVAMLAGGIGVPAIYSFLYSLKRKGKQS